MKTIISLFSIISMTATARAEVASIEDLGTTSITAPYFPTEVTVSRDGSAIVGWGRRRQNTSFLWTRETNRSIDLGAIVQLPPGPIPFETYAYAVSNGGQYVAGFAAGGGAFRWSPEGSQLLGNLPNGGGSGSARGISADGSVIAGFADDASGNSRAFRWTENTGMENLGTLPGDLTSQALAISADGSVILGTSGTDPQANTQKIFRWTQGGGMVNLGEITGEIGGINANSEVVVGVAENEAFRWTAESGRQGLGRFSGGQGYSIGNAVSEDGRVIVGWGTDSTRPNSGDPVSFVHYDGQLVRLDNLLEEQGVDLSDWNYLGPAEFVVSQGDGSYLIGGAGTKPQDDGFQSVPRLYLATVCLDEDSRAPEGTWSLHNALGWVFDTGTGWQFSNSLNEWFYIDGAWGWTQQDGWHYLGFPNWIWRARDGHWMQINGSRLQDNASSFRLQ